MILWLLACATSSGLVFDGVDDLVQVQGVTGLDGPALSLEIWATLAEKGPVMGDLMDQRDASGDTFLFRVRREPEPRLEFGVGRPGQEWGLRGQTVLPVGKIVMLAVTQDRQSGDTRLYVDGRLDVRSQCQAPVMPGPRPLWIGGDPRHGPKGRPFAGIIHAVLAFDTLRDDVMIAQDAQQRPSAQSPGLRLYWTGAAQSAEFILGTTAQTDNSDPKPFYLQ